MTSTTLNFHRYANHIGYSDVTPYEVIRAISDKCVEVRKMNAERDENWKAEFVTGGFAGVCINQNDQRWVITSDPNGVVERVRLHRDGYWYGVGKRRFSFSDTPRRYYDFNF